MGTYGFTTVIILDFLPRWKWAANALNAIVFLSSFGLFGKGGRVKKKTLQQIADEQGVTKQTVWKRTEKGKAYQKAYRKTYRQTPKQKAYQKEYRKAYHKGEKYKAYQKEYRKAYQKGEKYKEYQKEYKRGEKYKAYRKAYYLKNKVKK